VLAYGGSGSDDEARQRIVELLVETGGHADRDCLSEAVGQIDRSYLDFVERALGGQTVAGVLTPETAEALSSARRCP